MQKDNFYVYITTNPRKTVLYTGVTNNLKVRIRQHYDNRGNKKNFSGKYFCYKLIYYEHHFDINQAIAREKVVKDLSREKKKELIKSKNAHWNFLVL